MWGKAKLNPTTANNKRNQNESQLTHYSLFLKRKKMLVFDVCLRKCGQQNKFGRNCFLVEKACNNLVSGLIFNEIENNDIYHNRAN